MPAIIYFDSDRAEELFNAVRNAGGWIDRADLANATGKNQLSPNDLKHLQKMKESGILESGMIESESKRKVKYAYRIPVALAEKLD